MSLVAWKRRAEAVKFDGEAFDNLDLRSMKAFGSTWTNCHFRYCQFDLTDWRASKFDGCTFSHCKMRLVNFATSFFEKTSFITCDLEQASFMGSQFRDCDFSDCRLAYGDTMFQDVTVKQGLVFLGSNLHGSNLDFREVEPETMYFNGCNLWGAKISLGCAVWNGRFDDRTVRQFLALVARVSDDPHIAELAGDQYPVICRAMNGREKCSPDSTTTPATTSTPILNSAAQTATTEATPNHLMETIPKAMENS